LFETPAETAELKLMDFGLSTAIATPDEVLTEGLGSAYYIAPEIFKRRYTRSADVWALGVVLYLLLCGEVPFGHDAQTEQQVYRAIQDKPLRFTSFWNGMSSASRELVSGLLEKDPAKRYTVEQALAHPWVSGDAASDRPIDRALIHSLLNFNAKNKFKDAALKLVAAKLSAHDVQSLRDAFHRIDRDNTGFLTFAEMKVALREAGLPLDEESAARVMAAVDTDGDNRISWAVRAQPPGMLVARSHIRT